MPRRWRSNPCSPKTYGLCPRPIYAAPLALFKRAEGPTYTKLGRSPSSIPPPPYLRSTRPLPLSHDEATLSAHAQLLLFDELWCCAEVGEHVRENADARFKLFNDDEIGTLFSYSTTVLEVA